MVLPLVLIAVISYFLGCSNGAVIVSKYILRDDVRNHGSGNAGLTNFHRTFGGGLTLVVILSDVVKAVLAVWLGTLIMGSMVSLEVPMILLAKYWAGAFCLIGHMFPCMFGFRGGKGILSGGTIAIMLDWRLALLVWGAFLILAIITRYVSLGSIAAGALFPVGTLLFHVTPWDSAYTWGEMWAPFVLSLFIGGMIVWKHRGNLDRLIKGTESKFSLHKKSK